MDEQRIGRVIRALRHRRGWRQVDLAREAGLSQDVVSRVERGRVRRMAVEKFVRVTAALDAELVMSVRWRAGELDKLLDEGHAAVVGWSVRLLAGLGWEVETEVTFAIYHDRGSIDILAWHSPTRTLLVVEVKTELTSLEETLRRHDAKQRVAPQVAAERFGWTAPSAVCRLLVVAESSTSRRRVARHGGVLDSAYRLRGDAARHWLRSPTGPASLLLFAPLTRGAVSRCGPVSRKRVRRPNGSVAAA